jgi:hypothetical protein
MNHTSEVSVKEGQVILADCPNYGHVIDFCGGKPRTSVAVRFNTNLIESKPFSNGFRIVNLDVYDIDGKRGDGCDECLGQGQIAEYQRRDLSPYYRLRPCPHCTTDE